MKKAILLIILINTMLCSAQTRSIQGCVIQFETQTPIAWCRILLNNSTEYFADSNGCFQINTEIKKNDILTFVSLGYYTLTLKNIPKIDSLKLDTVMLVTIDVGDDFFVTIKKNGRQDKAADKKRNKKNLKEMIMQASQAYIFYGGVRFRSRNKVVILK